MSNPNKEINFINGNTLELHYYLKNGSHSMDAFVQHKCETEILGIFKEVLNAYSFEVRIETEPFGEGGLKRWFKVIQKEEGKKAVITSAIIVSICTTILVTPLTTSISTLTEQLIQNALEDPEIKKLEKEKLNLEVQKLRKDLLIVPKNDTSSTGSSNDLNDIKFKKKKSVFYETLNNYKKVEKISLNITDEKKNKLSDDQVIEKNDFKKFILVSDDLEPIEIEDAEIEIISPVLKKGRYKWRGYYKDEVISFYIKSMDFKSLVQKGEVQFKNGTTINCLLIIKRKIDGEGNIIITGYEVESVNHYYKNDKPIETREGKRKRRERSEKKDQINLFRTREDDDNEL